MPGEVHDGETVSRFMDERGKFSPVNGLVKPAAFFPAKNGKTSVFRVLGRPDEEVWRDGQEFVEPKRGKPILARADIVAGDVRSTGLKVIEAEPPPRHANIEGWPAPDDPESIEKRNQLVQELASKANLVLRK